MHHQGVTHMFFSMCMKHRRDFLCLQTCILISFFWAHPERSGMLQQIRRKQSRPRTRCKTEKLAPRLLVGFAGLVPDNGSLLPLSRHRSGSSWSRCPSEQSLCAQILVNIGPMNAIAASGNTPIRPLALWSGRGCKSLCALICIPYPLGGRGIFRVLAAPSLEKEHGG